MSEQTIRSRVAEIAAELQSDDVQPFRARAMAAQLSALLMGINAELRDAELAFNAVRLGFLNGTEKANHAKLRAEASPEYARYREARDVKESVKAMRATLNTVLRSLSDEMQLSR